MVTEWHHDAVQNAWNMGKIRVDLAGKTFGRLTVTERVPPVQGVKRVRWRCRCICGNETVVDARNLTTGNSTSCGCKRAESLIKIRPGMEFGRLTVMTRDGSRRHGKSMFSNWLCKCSCGSEKSVIGMSLLNGDTQSCGCLLQESAGRTGLSSWHDLTDQKFGFLTVITRASQPRQLHFNVKWLCVCNCGNLTIVRGHSLSAGLTVSCGCKIGAQQQFRNDHVALRGKIAGVRRRATMLAAFRPFDESRFATIEREMYEIAKRKTVETGEPWEVDHIVPLKSLYVCGLHNEFNLQVIPRRENIKKRNHWWPDMPPEIDPRLKQ